MEILLQELVLTVEPLLTAVYICEGGTNNSSITELSNYRKTLTYVHEKPRVLLILRVSSSSLRLFFTKIYSSELDSSELQSTSSAKE